MTTETKITITGRTYTLTKEQSAIWDSENQPEAKTFAIDLLSQLSAHAKAIGEDIELYHHDGYVLRIIEPDIYA